MIAVILSIMFALVFLAGNVYAKGYGSILCEEPKYTCYVVQRGDTWEKLFPDENERDIVMRINRMNTKLYSGLKIAIPQTIGSSYMDYAPFPQYIEPPGKKFILISIPDLAFGAYDAKGNLENWGPISAGRNYCSDIRRGCRSPAGKFFIYTKKGPGCVSGKFPIGRGGAPMPYCMFFRGGFALHGSYKVPGYNDSHGCIRLFVKDAQWLNQTFTADEYHVPVIIKR